jgi:hypothetical protein
VKLRVYVLEAHLPKIFSNSYLINIIIFLLLIELSSNKLRHRRRITYPLRVDIVYTKTYDYSNSITTNSSITRITKRYLKQYKVNASYFNFYAKSPPGSYRDYVSIKYMPVVRKLRRIK